MHGAVVLPSAAGRAASEGRDPRWALVVAILGSSMAFLDSTVVNVALPVMQRSLGATVGQLQWVVEAYALLLASLVLVGGALGDRLGRRTVFVTGVVTFAIASAACGAAPRIGLLIAARAVQGAGAALLVPGSLALISASYPAERRGAAIGSWSAWSAITGAVGPVVGGWVASHASWRWLFFFNVPVAGLVVTLAIRRVAETRDPDAPPRLDLAGAALATLGLGLVVYALIEAGPTGLGSGRTQASAGARRGRARRVRRRRGQSGIADGAAAAVPVADVRGDEPADAAALRGDGRRALLRPLQPDSGPGLRPAAAGAALLPLVLLISTMSRWAGALASRIGARPLLFGGPLVAATGSAAGAPGWGGVTGAPSSRVS